jgi:D-alanyl-D-alanine dipeptidase
VPLRENGEPLVDLRVACPNVIIMRPQVIPFLRQQVAHMLHVASESIPDSMRLAVIDAWRPFARQVRIYEFMTECARKAFPDRDPIALKRTVNRWVAPIDRKSPPGHCTGAAVDVFLVDPEGKELDVVSPFTRFLAAPTASQGLSPVASHNRSILVNAMLGAGFSNCRDEYWHYSFGDAGWAVRTLAPECFYGLAELDPSLYAEQERLAEEAMRRRPNPFLEG